MKAIYRTASFLFCIAMVFVNLALFWVSSVLHNEPLMKLNLTTMALCMVGAGTHWYLDWLYGKR